LSGAALDLETWHDFFVAAAGAAAALSGLIFVAVSINLPVILAEEKKTGNSNLTGRALESLYGLLIVLGVSLTGLDPSVGRGVFAAVLLVSAAGAGVSPVRSTLSARTSSAKPVGYNLRRFLSLLLVMAYAVCAATLLAGAGGGLHWLLPAFLLAVGIAATNAWILLVEVLR
jgi:modulator of FtsH protease